MGVRIDKLGSTGLFLWTFRSFLFINTHILRISRVSRETFCLKSPFLSGMHSDQNVAYEILLVFVKVNGGYFQRL